MRKLWLIFGIFNALLLFSSCSNGQKSGIKNLSFSEFQAGMNNPDVVVLDARTPEEVEAGYIEGATLFLDYNESGFEEKIANLDKSKTYYVYCKSGGRSGNTCILMKKNGLKSVNLEDGIIGWKGKIVRKG